jgi:hypothetical protein
MINKTNHSIAFLCAIPVIFNLMSGYAGELETSNQLSITNKLFFPSTNSVEIVNSKTNLNLELIQAGIDFKSKPGFRQAAAKILIPHIKRGMNTNGVITLLGNPSSITESEGRQSWDYVIFYSQAVFITFDTNKLVDVVEHPYNK